MPTRKVHTSARIDPGRSLTTLRRRFPRRIRWVHAVLAAAPLVATAILTVPSTPAFPAGDPARTGGATGTAEPPRVTPVQGQSWLRHLGLTVDETNLGKMGGAGPIPATARREPEIGRQAPAPPSALTTILRRFLSLFRTDEQRAHGVLDEPFQLTGADLYRLNCQSCHGPDGTGAPPEIKSLLGPVRGASAAALERRMRTLDRPISAKMADQLASQAEEVIRQRLIEGGKRMPAFAHLRGDEVDALLGYLGVLAGVPATSRTTMLVSQSAARVGEHVIKGTCHICHDATGPGAGHMGMMQRTIPSLASMPRQQSLGSVQRQVQYGSSGMMMMMGGQSMPSMPYLTQEEIAAAYFYLAYYPPRP